MGGAEQVEPYFRELTFDFLDQIPVRKREPCFRRARGPAAKERIVLDDLSPAVQEHGVSGGWPCGRELDSGDRLPGDPVRQVQTS
jgi:hypothetical protein